MKVTIKLIVFLFIFCLVSALPVAMYNSRIFPTQTPPFLHDMLLQTQNTLNLERLTSVIDQLIAHIRSLL